MSPRWRDDLSDEDDMSGFRGSRKIEKIRKEKRSVRGRTVDDWLVDIDGRDAEEAREEIERMLESGHRRGRVIEVHKRHVFVAEEDAEGHPDTRLLWLCTVAKRHFQRAHRERNFVVVGDRVLFQPDIDVKMDAAGEPVGTDLPRGLIQHAFVRKTRLSRKDPLHPEWEHVMLANIDLMVITASVLNPEVRWGLIDRILVQTELDAVPAVIVLNKVDLLENKDLASPEFLAQYKRRVEIYRQIGYEVFEICALKPKRTPDAIKRLKALFRGKLVGFCGHSGVGKSSIVNLMEPEFEQIVDENPDIFYKGRHTTTYNSLLRLGVGAYAIDTPGVRAFDTEVSDPITLTACFREFAGYHCRYRECAHMGEPGCAIQEALSEGKISQERFRSYQGILKGVSFREGSGFENDAEAIADLKAREYARDVLSNPEALRNEGEVSAPEPEDEAPVAGLKPEETIVRRMRRVRLPRRTTGEGNV